MAVNLFEYLIFWLNRSFKILTKVNKNYILTENHSFIQKSYITDIKLYFVIFAFIF